MLYFFDMEDGAHRISDDCGSDLPDDIAARYEAKMTLAEMARERLRDPHQTGPLAIEVSDAYHQVLFSVRLVYEEMDAPATIVPMTRRARPR